MPRMTCLPLFLLLLLFQVACTDNDEIQPEPMVRAKQVPDLLGKWRLVKAAGSNGPFVATEIKDSRDFYEFRADSVFRHLSADTIQVAGRFSLRKNTKGEEYLLLTPQAGTALWRWRVQIGLSSTITGLLVESHLALDGPVYFYQKVEAGGRK